MKAINLTTHGKTTDQYFITLGNGAQHVFKSEKKLIRFINQTNKDLTSLLYSLNLLYSNLFSLYRLNWGLSVNNFAGNKPKYHKSNNELKKSLIFVENKFDDICLKSHHLNGSYFVFSHFNSLINELFNIISQLSDLTAPHSFTPVNYQLDTIKNQLIDIRAQLMNYSVSKATKIIDISIFPTLSEEYLNDHFVQLSEA